MKFGAAHSGQVRKWCAFGICIVGMAGIDYLLLLLQPDIRTIVGPEGIRTPDIDALRTFYLYKPFVEIALIAIVFLAALQIALPWGVERNEFNLLLGMIIGLTIGRSVFGDGEGFSTSFLPTSISGAAIGLLGKWLIDQRRP